MLQVWVVGINGRPFSVPKNSVPEKPENALVCTSCKRDDRVIEVNRARICECRPIIRSYAEPI